MKKREQTKYIWKLFLLHHNIFIYLPFCTISLIVTWITTISKTATKTFLILRICDVSNRSVRTEFRAINKRDSFIWRFDILKIDRELFYQNKEFGSIFSYSGFDTSVGLGCRNSKSFLNDENCSLTSFSIRCNSFKSDARIFFTNTKRNNVQI